MDKQTIKKAAEEAASAIGRMLKQEYRWHEGKWWLFTLGKPARELRQDEIDWHSIRGHAPFVKDGITPDDPRWWDGV